MNEGQRRGLAKSHTPEAEAKRGASMRKHHEARFRGRIGMKFGILSEREWQLVRQAEAWGYQRGYHAAYQPLRKGRRKAA